MQENENGVTVSVPSPSRRRQKMHFPDVSVQQMVEARQHYDAGTPFGLAFHFLTPDQKEFMTTGFLDHDDLVDPFLDEWDRD
jgi:hypothetical protein